MENVAGNTLRKWQRCNFLELDTDWATHENIIYIHILWTFVHIPIYRGGTHTIYYGVYICRRQRTLCEQKGRNEKSQKKRTTRHNVFYFIIMTTTCLCLCVHVHTIVVYMLYIYSVCRSGHSRFCWCQQRRRRKVFGNWTAFIGLGHAWAAADCFWVGIGTGRAYVTVCTLNIDHLREFFEVLR